MTRCLGPPTPHTNHGAAHKFLCDRPHGMATAWVTTGPGRAIQPDLLSFLDSIELGGQSKYSSLHWPDSDVDGHNEMCHAVMVTNDILR